MKSDIDIFNSLKDDDERPICLATHIEDGIEREGLPINIKTGVMIYGNNGYELLKKSFDIKIIQNGKVIIPTYSSGYYTNKNKFIKTRVLW